MEEGGGREWGDSLMDSMITGKTMWMIGLMDSMMIEKTIRKWGWG